MASGCNSCRRVRVRTQLEIYPKVSWPAFAGHDKLSILLPPIESRPVSLLSGKIKVATRSLVSARIEAVIESAVGHAPVLQAASLVALVKGLLLVPVGLGKTCRIAPVVFFCGLALDSALSRLTGLVTAVERVERVALFCGSARRITLVVGIPARDGLCRCTAQAQDCGAGGGQRERVDVSHRGLLKI